jgi:tRNA(adenine34) deaminase
LIETEGQANFWDRALAVIMDEILNFSSDTYFMGEALRQARKGESQGEVPIGAVIVRNSEIIARAWNQVEILKDATAHAEMLAITQAASVVGDWRLDACDLYVTKEPCPMCAGAIVQARLQRVIYGCPDPKTGGAGGMINLLQMPPLNHQCDITRGVREIECRELLQRFFKERRS